METSTIKIQQRVSILEKENNCYKESIKQHKLIIQEQRKIIEKLNKYKEQILIIKNKEEKNINDLRDLKNLLKEKEELIKNLYSEGKDYQEKYQKCQNKNNLIIKSLNSYKDSCSELTDDITNKNSQIYTYEREVESMKHDIDIYKEKFSEICDANKICKEQLNDRNRIINEITNKNEIMTSDIMVLRNVINSLQNSVFMQNTIMKKIIEEKEKDIEYKIEPNKLIRKIIEIKHKIKEEKTDDNSIINKTDINNLNDKEIIKRISINISRMLLENNKMINRFKTMVKITKQKEKNIYNDIKLEIEKSYENTHSEQLDKLNKLYNKISDLKLNCLNYEFEKNLIVIELKKHKKKVKEKNIINNKELDKYKQIVEILNNELKELNENKKKLEIKIIQSKNKNDLQQGNNKSDINKINRKYENNNIKSIINNKNKNIEICQLKKKDRIIENLKMEISRMVENEEILKEELVKAKSIKMKV